MTHSNQSPVWAPRTNPTPPKTSNHVAQGIRIETTTQTRFMRKPKTSATFESTLADAKAYSAAQYGDGSGWTRFEARYYDNQTWHNALNSGGLISGGLAAVKKLKPLDTYTPRPATA